VLEREILIKKARVGSQQFIKEIGARGFGHSRRDDPGPHLRQGFMIFLAGSMMVSVPLDALA
jgi:hypothetical protein